MARFVHCILTGILILLMAVQPGLAALQASPGHPAARAGHQVVNLTLADAQFGIGGLFTDASGNPVNGGEGSLGHALLHGLAGCAAAEAQGADCAAGAAGAIAAAIYSGALDGSHLSIEQQRDRAEIMGGVVGYLFSGGEAANVDAASSIAVSALANNRQLHMKEIEWLRANAAEFAALLGISEEEALRRLTIQAAAEVDTLYQNDANDPEAAEFLATHKPTGFIPGTGGTGDYLDHNQEWFAATPEQKASHLINASTVVSDPDLYRFLDGFNAANGGARLGDPVIFLSTQLQASAGGISALSPDELLRLTRTVKQQLDAMPAGDYTPAQIRFYQTVIGTTVFNELVSRRDFTPEALTAAGLKDTEVAELVAFYKFAADMNVQVLDPSGEIGPGFVDVMLGDSKLVAGLGGAATAGALLTTWAKKKWVKAKNRTLTFTETGTGTHLRRTVGVDGQTVQINSGHAYNRAHSGGDVRDSGLSMDQIDNAIVNDIAANVNVGSLPQVPQVTSNTININGYSLTYDVTRLPNGNVSVSTYYPGP